MMMPPMLIAPLMTRYARAMLRGARGA